MEAFADPLLWGLTLTGVLLGMLVGLLPGLGPPAAIALLFPLVYTLPPLPGIAILAGIFYGAKYGGAVTSIMLGIPGEPDAVATLLEGYPLTRAGRARQALRVAILSSFLGSMLALGGVALLAPLLGRAALAMGPPQRGLLLAAALVLVAVLGPGARRKNALMVFAGLALALVGLDPIHGTERLTMGFLPLGGLELSSMLLGLYGLGDILDEVLGGRGRRECSAGDYTPEEPRPRELLAAGGRGAVLGFLTGLVPSGAGVTASFASYALEKKLSPRKEHFGKGVWSGLAGPEAANNAAALGSFAPLLLLGLPTNPIMAVLLAALTVYGLVPGPELPLVQHSFYTGLMFSLVLGNLFLLGLGLGLAPLWAALASVPSRRLWPVITGLCLVGAWVSAGGLDGPVQCLAFGLLSLLLRRGGFSPAPLVLAFVLGRSLEGHLVQTLMSYGGPFWF